MPTKRKRCVSISKTAYQQLRAIATTYFVSMGRVVEVLVGTALGEPPARPASKPKKAAG